jgi:cell division transport system permease protein
MFLKLYRTLKTGLQNFYRNGWLSLATISVIVVTLFIVNIQIAVTVANHLLLQDVQDRVSISVYFNSDVSESDVMKVKDEFSRYQEIKSIEYISKEDALEQFKERNKENETIQKSIEELGVNPLGATLNIKAHDPSQYEVITSSIENSKYKDLISRVNYHKYKEIIENLSREASSNQRVSVILGLTLSLVAVLITFNSIRITMYAYRQEIEIMRLVGASNIYIRFPFVWEGIFYGAIGSLVVVPMFYFYLKFVSADGATGSILPFSNTLYLKMFLNDYFVPHIWIFIGVQLLLGVFLGVVSSMIAIRKYLKV